MFFDNFVKTVLGLQYFDQKYFNIYPDNLCKNLSNITIENCYFIDNTGSIFIVHSDIKFTCKVKVYFFNEIVYFAKNKVPFILYLTYLTIYMNGTITMFENYIQHNIMELEHCDISFSKTVAFLSNVCTSVISLISRDLPLIVMEHANITFFNTTYGHHLIFHYDASTGNNYLGIFPYCIFQYMTLTRVKYNVSSFIPLVLMTIYAA